MEQIKQTVLSAGKDAWNFLTGVTMSAAQSVSCAVSQTVGFAGEKLGELTKKYRQPLLMAAAIVSLAGAIVTGTLYLIGRRKSKTYAFPAAVPRGDACASPRAALAKSAAAVPERISCASAFF